MAGEARAEGRGDVIGQPGDDGNAGPQAGACSDGGADAADHVGGVADGAEEAAPDAGRGAEIGRIGTVARS